MSTKAIEKAHKIGDRAIGFFHAAIEGVERANALLQAEEAKHREEAEKHLGHATVAADSQEQNNRLLEKLRNLIS